MPTHDWSIGGKPASAQAIREALALERQSRKKRSIIEYERQQEERNARKVGAAIRKQTREMQRLIRPLRVKPHQSPGGRAGSRRCPRFEVMAGLGVRRPSHVGRDGLSSFHMKWTSRGLGQRRSQGSRRFRAGEAARHVRYILRASAREMSEGGIVSNISVDPDRTASLFSAIEELEQNGRANANIYISLVISLPHELSPGEREALLARICATFARDDLPHVGVLHRPDELGDDRNTHAHIMLSLRPFRANDDGSFSFSTGTCADFNDKSYIRSLRHEIAGLMNVAMIAAGHGRRFTALSNKERGLPARTRREGKSTPGRKHVERRLEQANLLSGERDFRREREQALHALQGELIKTLGVPGLDRAAMLSKLPAPAGIAARKAQGNQSEEVAISQPEQSFPSRPASQPLPPPRSVAPLSPSSLRSDYEVSQLLMHLRDRAWPPLVRENGVVRIATEPGSLVNALAALQQDQRVQPALEAEWASALARLRHRLSEADAFGRSPGGWVLNSRALGRELATFIDRNLKDEAVANLLEQNLLMAEQSDAKLREQHNREKKRQTALAANVAEAVSRICGPHRPGTASEAERRRIRDAVQALEAPLKEGLLTLHGGRDEIVVVGHQRALIVAAEKLGRDPLGWQALALIAGLTKPFLPVDQGSHQGSLVRPGPPSPSHMQAKAAPERGDGKSGR